MTLQCAASWGEPVAREWAVTRMSSRDGVGGGIVRVMARVRVWGKSFAYPSAR
jgi:hypothetical protein